LKERTSYNYSCIAYYWQVFLFIKPMSQQFCHKLKDSVYYSFVEKEVQCNVLGMYHGCCEIMVF